MLSWGRFFGSSNIQKLDDDKSLQFQKPSCLAPCCIYNTIHPKCWLLKINSRIWKRKLHLMLILICISCTLCCKITKTAWFRFWFYHLKHYITTRKCNFVNHSRSSRNIGLDVQNSGILIRAMPMPKSKIMGKKQILATAYISRCNIIKKKKLQWDFIFYFWEASGVLFIWNFNIESFKVRQNWE